MNTLSSRYRAVLFDLDGTLVDSIPDLASATNAMLNDLGMATLPLAQLSQFVGKGSDMLIKRALANKLIPDEPEETLFSRARQLFKKHYHHDNGTQSQLYPYVVEGLHTLQKAGLLLAVVTNKPEEFTHPLLDKMGITHFFDCIVSGDTCSRKKPFPDPLFYACKKLNISPQEALFIGDSINDAQAAQAAQMDVLLLPYGYNEGISVQTLKVNAIVEDIRFVAEWISAQNN
ncbi:phosphoglycolate phosphatase [Pelistega ratti]|uniref:phosphoglycolate phosphatase n=1 Tax=Pelistega ratti TaxID=2652177 RepID=UPI00135CC6CA|nr:phosphoglycolate phosphatase [Pelistega ratti]